MNTLYATNSHLPLFEVILPDPKPFTCNGDRGSNAVCCGVSQFEPREGFSQDSKDYPAFILGLHERMESSPEGSKIVARKKGMPSYAKVSHYKRQWKNLTTGEIIYESEIPQDNSYYVKGKGK